MSTYSHKLDASRITVRDYLLLNKVGKLIVGLKTFAGIKQVDLLTPIKTGKYYVSTLNDVNSPYYLNLDDKLEIL